MTTVLVGNTYIGASTDGGAPSAAFGYNWFQSDTGNLYVSSTLPQWVYMGNANEPSLGNLPTSGANMSGALTGAHGLMPLTSGNFASMPTVSSGSSQLPLVTQSYVDQRDNYVLSQISPQVQQALSSIPQISITANQTIISGVVYPSTPADVVAPGSLFTVSGGIYTPLPGTTLIIPQPYYADGSMPAVSEMNVMTSLSSAALYVPTNPWSAGMGGQMGARSGHYISQYVLFCPNPTVNPLVWVSAVQDNQDASWLISPMNYMVICTKTGS